LAIDPDQDGVDNDVDDPGIYRKTLDACFKGMKQLSVEQAIAKEKIAPLFSPNPENIVAETLISEIRKVKKGESIVGAIQHFTHTGIAKALIAACKKGVSVQMLMDDDIFTGESEVPGVSEFFNGVLDGSCIQTRFMQTNGAAFQLMHNKFLVLGENRVFAGAGHFTYSAMRDNYENFYLMQDDSIRGQYRDLFNSMWNVSISKKEITPVPEPTPADAGDQ
jgi:phosphatidylserine/phosphatidylglycerophosphate/cardiolipin synthase-like enzyme